MLGIIIYEQLRLIAQESSLGTDLISLQKSHSQIVQFCEWFLPFKLVSFVFQDIFSILLSIK
ncbi:hypothetical protein ABEZ88_22965 [Bacillus albus]|uniref:hypothetical protein n=1 Tax=Bacillus albus TaxID=2026189 RepID=UPI003D1937C1